MANLIKLKLGISAFAISVLAIIPLLESNFYAPVVIKRWGKLSWDDFQGFIPPFSGYEAVISSNVYLEYDSASTKYRAYAAQNNVRSWTKSGATENDYGLNHEQYHFNITELHARMLNRYIDENPDGSEDLFNLRLGSIRIDLREMQNQYDRETDHSINFDRQRRWEYKIDSLLSLESGWIVDHFSGARVYFPLKPDSIKKAKPFPQRGYTLNKYAMNLATFSFLYRDFNVAEAEAALYAFYGKDSLLVKSMVPVTSDYKLNTFVIAEDTTRAVSYYHRWVYQYPYLYKVLAQFNNNHADTIGYVQNANSFLNSFSIVDQDQYWISKLEKSDNPIRIREIFNMDEGEDIGSEYCVTIGPAEQDSFHRGPFYRDDGALFLAYDYLTDQDSLHFKDVLLLNKELYTYTPTPEGQIFFIPQEKIPTAKYRIDFGYILKGDSTKECYLLHHDALHITPDNEQ